MRFVLLLCVAACGSSGADVSGTTPGGSIDISATVSAVVTISDGADSTSEARIIMASNDSVCADAGAMPPIDRKGSRFIAITLRDVSGSTAAAPAAAGTYTIYPNTGSQPPKEALLDTGGLDDTCQSADDEQASGQSGSVVLESTSGGAFKGTFDVVLNTGDHITGSFDPIPCPALQSLTMGGEHQCQ